MLRVTDDRPAHLAAGTAAALQYSTANMASPVTELLTQIDDALTAAAIVIGGAFAYLKFVKGRVLSASVDFEIKASVSPPLTPRRHMPRQPFAGHPVEALMIEVAIRNNGQLALTVPKDSEQLISVSSVTVEELARCGHQLTQDALSWKQPDAYFARANILLDNGEPPLADLKLGPGDVLRLGVVFAIPGGHNAAAYLVVLNSFTVSRRWLRPAGRWNETRTLVVPDSQAT
jgi:hypothetical protein